MHVGDDVRHSLSSWVPDPTLLYLHSPSKDGVLNHPLREWYFVPERVGIKAGVKVSDVETGNMVGGLVCTHQGQGRGHLARIMQRGLAGVA